MLRTAFMISTTALLMLAAPSAAQDSQTPAQPKTEQTQPTQKETQREAPAQPGAHTERLDFYTVQTNDFRASDLIGMRVYNANNENVGEIDDLILDDNGQTLKAVVLGVGGFLGVGERSVAVEPGSVMIQRQPDGSERALVYATKENLENAPELERQARAR